MPRRCAHADLVRRGDPLDQRALARDGLIELGYAPGEAEELLNGPRARAPRS